MLRLCQHYRLRTTEDVTTHTVHEDDHYLNYPGILQKNREEPSYGPTKAMRCVSFEPNWYVGSPFAYLLSNQVSRNIMPL